MDPRRLRHVMAVAECKSFARAADRCNLSQSALSRSIQAAEEELGLRLFERSTVEVRCTPAGEFVVERARRLLFESRCMERDISLYRERQMGDLAFGVGPYPAATIVPGLVVELRRLHAGVKLRVEVNNATYLMEHLRAEELDFYLADLSAVPAVSDLEIMPLGELVAGFYVRPGHPLAQAGPVAGSALLPHGLVSVRVPDAILLALGRIVGLPSGTRFPLALECDDLSLLKTVAMDTDSVLACPQYSARHEVAQGQLVPLQVADFPRLGAQMGVVRLKGRSDSPIAQCAIDFLIQQTEAR